MNVLPIEVPLEIYIAILGASATIVAAFGTIAIKSIKEHFDSRSRRKNLRSALRAYIKATYTDFTTGNERNTQDERKDAIKKIEETDGEYFPMLVVDQTTGISIQFLLKEYAFLGHDAMNAIVDMTNTRNLIVAFAQQMNTDHIRSLPVDRKVKVFKYYAGLVKQNEDEAKKALKALPPVSGEK